MKTLLRILMVCGACLGLTPTGAAEWDGAKTVVGLTRDGQRLTLGKLEVQPLEGGKARVKVVWDEFAFTDHFLSMKEFKCVQGGPELVCHVPYPYANPGIVGPNDLAWLEHQMLFLFKQPGEFGAKLWNGLYFKLEPTDKGWRGRAQAIDLNRISAPPDRPELPPFKPAWRDDLPDGARWINTLLIE